MPVCDIAGNGVPNTFNTFGPTGLISRHFHGGTGFFYAFDPQGGKAQHLNPPDASILTSSFFSALGSRVSGAASTEAYSGFTGQAGGYFDAETGLVLMGHRYYDPSTGRFLNRDPIGYNGGVNLYSYVANGFGNALDPSGFYYTPIDRGPINPWQRRMWRAAQAADNFRQAEWDGLSSLAKLAGQFLGDIADHLFPTDECPCSEGGGGSGGEPETYEIQEGVHRARAAHEVGDTEIPARIDGGPVTNVPIGKLRSPKTSLNDDIRWGKALRRARARTEGGLPLDPQHAIDITPGGRGIPIPDVEVPSDPFGIFR